jgi:hypothetical protein
MRLVGQRRDPKEVRETFESLIASLGLVAYRDDDD